MDGNTYTLYDISLMAHLKQRIINASDDKPLVWWRCIDNVLLVWEHGEETLEKFLYKLNTFHLTIKFTAEYSKETINT